MKRAAPTPSLVLSSPGTRFGLKYSHARAVTVCVILVGFLTTRPVALIPVGVGTAICAVCAVALLALSGPAIARVLQQTPVWPLAAFTMMAGFSIAWSQDRPTSAEGFLDLASSLIVCVGAVLHLSVRRFLRAFQIGVSMCLLASLACVIVAPQIGITWDGIYDGAWKGATAHKNGLGMVALVSCLLAALQLAMFGRRTRLLLLICADFYLAYRSESTGALALMVGAVAICLVSRLVVGRTQSRQLGGFVASGFVVVVSMVLLVVVTHLNQAIDAFGKNGTFASRLLIWKGSLAAVGPWKEFGVGWAAGLKLDEVLAVIAQFSHYDVTSTHNGLLYVLLGLGYVGIAIAILCIATTIGSLVVLIRVSAGKMLCLAGSFFLMLVGDMFETRLYQGVGWMYWCMTAVLVVAWPPTQADRTLDSSVSTTTDQSTE